MDRQPKDDALKWGCWLAIAGALLVILGSLLGCTGMGVGLPSNKAFVQVRNLSGVPVRLLLEDAPRLVERDGTAVMVTRLYDKGPIPPDGIQHWQWPFAAERGRVSIVVGSDTTQSPWFRPWTMRKWYFDILPNTFAVRSEER